MNVRLSIEKDNSVLSSETYEIRGAADFEIACADIWRRARQVLPLDKPDEKLFLSGLDDLWGATMKLDKA